MKYLIILASIAFGSFSFAKNASKNPQQDPCLETLRAEYEQTSKGAEWGYENLLSLSHKDAKIMIKEALAEDEEKDRPVMMSFVGKPNVLFYVLGWNAPSNTGTTLIAADKNTCKVLEDLLYWSEE